jgi:hypothetical protein
MEYGVSYALNGTVQGPAAPVFNVGHKLAGGFDVGLLRPFIEDDPDSPERGRPCAILRNGMIYNNQTKTWHPKHEKRTIDYWERVENIRSPAFNSVIFTRTDWVQVDRSITKANRLPLTAYSDVRAADTLGGFDAWNKLTIEYAAMSDAGEVVADMDGTSPARDDTPLELLRSTPLPVRHGDFSYPQRLLDVARASGMPLDTTMFEQVTRRLWESVEKLYIGTETGVTYGGRTTGPFPQTGASTEFGLTNYTYRITKTDLTIPTGSNPEAVNQDVMEMVETMRGYGFMGPFILYYSTPYGAFINGDYFRTGGTSAVTTLRQRILLNAELADVRRLDYLTSGYQLILVDYGRGQIQAVDGMQPKPFQWSERAGLIQKFMVAMIQTVIFRTQYSGIAPILHATTS